MEEIFLSLVMYHSGTGSTNVRVLSAVEARYRLYLTPVDISNIRSLVIYGVSC